METGYVSVGIPVNPLQIQRDEYLRSVAIEWSHKKARRIFILRALFIHAPTKLTRTPPQGVIWGSIPLCAHHPYPPNPGARRRASTCVSTTPYLIFLCFFVRTLCEHGR
jgi:hypothetical protein